MAEKFINFVAIAKAGTEQTIIPSGASGSNTSFVGANASTGTNTRDLGSVILVNGLYISGTASGNYKFSLYIRDKNYASRPITVLNNIAIPDQTSFFLERPITLNVNEYLTIIAPTSGNPTNATLNITASSIEVVD